MAWARGIHNEKAAHQRYGVANEAPSTAKARQQTAIPAWDTSQRTAARLEVLRPGQLEVTDTALAYVAPGCFPEHPPDQPLLLYEGAFPKALLTARPDPRVPAGRICLSEVQQFNLKVVPQSSYEWAVWAEPVPLLCALTAEITPRERPCQGPVRIDSRRVSQALGKQLWKKCVTVHQRFGLEVDGEHFVATVTELSQSSAEEEEEDLYCTGQAARRGLVDADTVVYLGVDTHLHGPGALELINPVSPESSRVPKEVLHLYSNDPEPEHFPVKKRMLQSCIKLTKWVLSKDEQSVAGQIPEVHCQVGCLTLDRVLLFLEQAMIGNGHNFVFDLEYLPELQAAAEALGCQPLADLCRERGGEFESRVRREGLDYLEVMSRNADGEVLIVIDGMVFDVTRWLPEHPGGSAIIPEQAINMDATTFFEMYHLSRRSFQYLEQFYIGDLKPSELAKVPVREYEKPPSSGFLEQLRDFTTWRVQPTSDGVKAFKSF